MRPFSKAPALVQIVLILLVIEALVLAAIFFTLLFELLSGQYQSIYAEVFLLVLAAGATFWVLTFSRGLLNKKRWARSAAFFWQLLQAVVGAGAIAETGTSRIFGALLVLISGLTVLLLFNSKVVEATNEETDGDLTN
jgi:membrane protease YdiL (CAAX protease family)